MDITIFQAVVRMFRYVATVSPPGWIRAIRPQHPPKRVPTWLDYHCARYKAFDLAFKATHFALALSRRPSFRKCSLGFASRWFWLLLGQHWKAVDPT